MSLEEVPPSNIPDILDETNVNQDEPTETKPAPPPIPVVAPADPSKDSGDKKKEDDKLSMYKALAIKLKKDLVKTRDELQKLRDDSIKECTELRDKAESLNTILDFERQSNCNTILTLEAKVKSLKEQLQNTEAELQLLQNDFEDYKVRASKLMQQNTSIQSNSNKTFEEARYKQLKELSDQQMKQIDDLEYKLSKSLDINKELKNEAKLSQDQLEILREKLRLNETLESKYEALCRENENLRITLEQYRLKLNNPTQASYETSKIVSTEETVNKTDKANCNDTIHSLDDQIEDIQTHMSPSASIRDDSHTNSNSSYDGSTSGYVHVRPTTFEIISRSSVLEDAQNQIDNLTKAYLDSENTNSLLSEQVKALKEEIRRMQRGTERLDLAENLEYLKNIVFKFLSLDSSQMEQKQRLVPVLSTVLKLSPDETAKLNSLAIVDKMSMASSFFKI